MEIAPVGFRIEVIPDDPEERLAFYDKIFYEAYTKKLKLEIWDIGVGMSSTVEGDYCLLCKIQEKKKEKKSDDQI